MVYYIISALLPSVPKIKDLKIHKTVSAASLQELTSWKKDLVTGECTSETRHSRTKKPAWPSKKFWKETNLP